MDQFERGEVVELLKSPAAKGIVVSVDENGDVVEVQWVVASGMQGKTTAHHSSELCKVRDAPQPRTT
jgi:hypothetical protein